MCVRTIYIDIRVEIYTELLGLKHAVNACVCTCTHTLGCNVDLRGVHTHTYTRMHRCAHTCILTYIHRYV